MSLSQYFTSNVLTQFTFMQKANQYIFTFSQDYPYLGWDPRGSENSEKITVFNLLLTLFLHCKFPFVSNYAALLQITLAFSKSMRLSLFTFSFIIYIKKRYTLYIMHLIWVCRCSGKCAHPIPHDLLRA